MDALVNPKAAKETSKERKITSTPIIKEGNLTEVIECREFT